MNDANTTISLLQKRRSAPAASLTAPGPSPAEIQTILEIAARVPDHGKLAPWRFIVFEGDGRDRAGQVIADIYARLHPEASPEKLAVERLRFSHAPLVAGVVSKAGPHEKIPEWEQVLSAGAVCMNLIVAANALGYASVWLSEWYSYDREVLTRFGLSETEKIAGFIHIGRPESSREDRPRPSLEQITAYF